MVPSDQPLVGADKDYLPLTGLAQFADHAVSLVARVHMELVLFSYELDRRIYSSEAFTEPLKKFLLSHERARMRVLVNSAETAVRTGNRLIELGRMLSSRVEFRDLPEEKRELREEYLVCDARSYIYRREPSDLEARYYADAPLQARGLLRIFEELWQISPPARELRDLKI